MTEAAFRTIFERCNGKCAQLYFTAAIPRTQEACRNAGALPSLGCSSTANTSDIKRCYVGGLFTIMWSPWWSTLLIFPEAQVFWKVLLPRSSTFLNGQCACLTPRLLFSRLLCFSVKAMFWGITEVSFFIFFSC